MPCRSLPYCLRSLAISGWSSCMARCDLTCLTNSGKSSSRTVTTRKMIDSAQVIPQDGSRNVENRACHCFITNEIAVYSQSSNGGLLVRGPAPERRGGGGVGGPGGGAGGGGRGHPTRPPPARRGGGPPGAGGGGAGP